MDHSWTSPASISCHCGTKPISYSEEDDQGIISVVQHKSGHKDTSTGISEIFILQFPQITYEHFSETRGQLILYQHKFEGYKSCVCA